MTDLFREVAYGQISDAVAALDKRVKSGLRQEDAWNSTSVELTKAAMAHVRYFVVRNFADALQDSANQFSMAVKKILTNLFNILCCSWIQLYFGDFVCHTSIKVS